MAVSRPYSPWVPYYNPDKAYNGYTLFTPMRQAATWLIDMAGCPVHCWELPYPLAFYGALLPNGNLLGIGTNEIGPNALVGGAANLLVEMDWDSNIVWKYEDKQMHHDFWRLDNGNTMILRHVPLPEEIADKVKGGRPGSGGKGVLKLTDSFIEVTPDGETVWEWLGYEHLDPEIDTICPMCALTFGEWTHGNSCFILPNGDILTTFLRTINSVVIIDRSTGAIKWRWGAGELAHPHDPTMLDNGNILIFDNGTHRQKGFGNYSRVVEVNPKTNEIEWEYKDDPPDRFFSHFISGCQRLPNGNTLICAGVQGRFFEVTPEKEIVWEYNNPFYLWRPNMGWTNTSFRAFRYSPDYEGLKGKDLRPDRVELTLREKPRGKGEEAIQERLARLGY